jgi:hypothetical protein
MVVWLAAPEGLKRLPLERQPKATRAVWWGVFAWLVLMLLITLAMVG